VHGQQGLVEPGLKRVAASLAQALVAVVELHELVRPFDDGAPGDGFLEAPGELREAGIDPGQARKGHGDLPL